MTNLRIPYESEGFRAGTIANGSNDLSVSWDDILWAAITVGRPNRQYVFKQGISSAYEAQFRWSLVRMSLEQSGITAFRLRRTEAAKTLDPSEKGAVSYFLGMTFCKLFATKLLDTPWLLHLDVFRPQLNPVLRGRSRPDLVGEVATRGSWHAFECKGRISEPDAKAKSKAKDQAQRLVSINGLAPSLHVGAFTFLRQDVLHFYWCDPEPMRGKPIEVPEIGEDAWRLYYGPAWELFREQGETARGELVVHRLAEDVEVRLHAAVAQALLRQRWEAARNAALEASEELASAGYQPDGLAVKAGQSWQRKFEEPT